MRRKLTLALAVVMMVSVMAGTASAATEDPQRAGPVEINFTGKGTEMSQLQAGTSSCWAYTVRMYDYSAGGIQIFRGYHDITWCASAGRVTSISKSCRGSATFPWNFSSCTRGTNRYSLPRTGSNSIDNATWTYCLITPVGCVNHGGFRDRVTVYANGGVTGTWWTW